ncbi:hypothetical protein [Emticicia sp. SJ17W-69]|uniref:hypothetical protein n=1 Tax=Emticicia sp. SJ17W-69 TaxID=3421657 RepID=UPI003EC0D20A
MKKASIILIVLFFGIAVKGFSQTDKPSDFFAGKWEVAFIGTPNGDAKMTTELLRKDGKLTGKLKPADGSDAIEITNVEEEAEKLTLFFSTQGYDLSVELKKVDADNLKGSLMNMFDATAKRIKDK